MPRIGRTQALKYAAVGTLLAISIGAYAVHRTQSPATPAVTATPRPRPRAAPTPTRIVVIKVYVAGAVVRPGVYELRRDGRVDDAVRAAGGPTERADLLRINLARPVSDGMQIVVPEQRGPGTPEPRARATATSASTVLNLNTATAADLDTLPGIGPVTAKRIVDYRAEHGPFARVEDLLTFRLVNRGVYQRIKDRLTTEMRR